MSAHDETTIHASTPARSTATPIVALAPMLDCTDRHFRYFLRLLSPNVRLYTEMITTGAILRGDTAKWLRFDDAEHPVAVQLGGADPKQLAACARICEDFGYDKINLNIGCPSDRVQSGQFGACLMLEPLRVAEGVAKMTQTVTIPVTVKTRIGVDEHDSYEALNYFVTQVAAAGCHTFIIHARKAWLKGLSPKQNRDIPPLNYDVVYRLKQDFPQLTLIINGGIDSIAEIQTHLQQVDGVMLGRKLYADPLILLEIEQTFFGAARISLSRHEILERYIPYIEKELQSGTSLQHMTRHILGLFQGQPGARAWRGYLSEHARQKGANIDVLRRAVPA